MPGRASPAKRALADRHDPQGLAAFVHAVPGVAAGAQLRRAHGARTGEVYLGYFVAWCTERGLARPEEITKPILERYQRSLYHWRKRDGAPLTFRGQHARLVPVRALLQAGSRGRIICSTTRPRSWSCRAWSTGCRSTC